jgi:putative toxin-antitoxin system antitoxin component (TIGR02293 family)
MADPDRRAPGKAWPERLARERRPEESRELVRRILRLEEPLGEEACLRAARIIEIAENVLGDRDKAARWLHEPDRALGGRTPGRLLGSDAGAHEVERVLGRIQHGVYS